MMMMSCLPARLEVHAHSTRMGLQPPLESRPFYAGAIACTLEYIMHGGNIFTACRVQHTQHMRWRSRET